MVLGYDPKKSIEIILRDSQGNVLEYYCLSDEALEEDITGMSPVVDGMVFSRLQI